MTDGWLLIVPVLPSGVRVVAFRSEDHARMIANGFPEGSVTLEPFDFIPDKR